MPRTSTKKDTSSKKGERTSLINTWVMDPEDEIVKSDGKLYIVNFEKAFGIDSLSVYDAFSIKKGSYENQLDIITRYINFFIKFYDEDKELIMAYLKCKYMIDKEKAFTAENMQAMIDYIYDIMFTPTMVEKIERMVEDNYLDDIECDKDGKYVAKKKKHLESLEFTNEHIKILLAISFGMKIMSPVIFHYFAINIIKLDKNSVYIYTFFKGLFDIFGGKCDMYNKIFVYTKTKVLESKANNDLIFSTREIMGFDVFSVIHKFVRKVLIEENMVKFKFNEHWDAKNHKYKENIIGFIKTIIKFQLRYFLKEEHAKNLTEVTYTKNSDGLSGADKMIMNLSKINEGDTLLAEVNAECLVEDIQKMYDVPISDEEIDFYVKYHHPSRDQIRLVYNFYAKYLGNCRDCKLLTRREYITLMLVLKKKLLFDAGVSEDDDNVVATTVLPYVLTGNIEGVTTNRIIRNKNSSEALDDSYHYNDLKLNRYKMLLTVHPDEIDSIISKFANSCYSYVCYENPEILGRKIEYSYNMIAAELIFFLRSS